MNFDNTTSLLEAGLEEEGYTNVNVTDVNTDDDITVDIDVIVDTTDAENNLDEAGDNVEEHYQNQNYTTDAESKFHFNFIFLIISLFFLFMFFIVFMIYDIKLEPFFLLFRRLYYIWSNSITINCSKHGSNNNDS